MWKIHAVLEMLPKDTIASVPWWLHRIGGHSLGVMPACPSSTRFQASLAALQGKLCSLKQQPMKACPEADSKYLEAKLLGIAQSFGAEVWREKSFLEVKSHSGLGKL